MLRSDSCAFARSAFLKDERGRAGFYTSQISRQGYAHTVGAVYLIEALIVWVLAGAARGRQRISRSTPGKRRATLGG